MGTKRSSKGFITFFLILIFSVFSAFSDANTLRRQLIAEAKTHIGKPYRSGTAGPNTFDCSGFVQYCCSRALEINLTKRASTQYSEVTHISKGQIQPGDLVFFDSVGKGQITHVGIYLGNDEFISALSEGSRLGIQISQINGSSYWRSKYLACGQVINGGTLQTGGIGSSNRNSPKVSVSNFKGTKSTYYRNTSKFWKYWTVDATAAAKWNFTDGENYKFVFEGAICDFNIRCSGFRGEPGLNVGLAYDSVRYTAKVPAFISLTLNDYLRVRAGTSINFDFSTMKFNLPQIPLLVGCSISTPYLSTGNLKWQLIQNVDYDAGDLNNQMLFLSTGIRLSKSL